MIYHLYYILYMILRKYWYWKTKKAKERQENYDEGMPKNYDWSLQRMFSHLKQVYTSGTLYM